MGEFIAAVITVLPIIIVAFLIRWIRIIKVNSDIQVEQNKQIISLLERMINNE
ncbi:hypothetical protein ACH0B5_05295 [Ureibacillus sp. 179-F W5.1 NHS]|uniref:hypothetical protein n=1 Tax=Bacillales TaxID=1385 RepID=UPI0015754167|nr:hypothetical protein [Lysinibacillus halotolerans]